MAQEQNETKANETLKDGLSTMIDGTKKQLDAAGGIVKTVLKPISENPEMVLTVGEFVGDVAKSVMKSGEVSAIGITKGIVKASAKQIGRRAAGAAVQILKDGAKPTDEKPRIVKRENVLLDVKLLPLESDDREQFIRDNQEAFKYGAMEEFGMRDDHFEEDGEIISRETIEKSIDEGVAYRIVQDGQSVGGVVLKIDKDHARGELELLFVSPQAHSKGIGYAAWCEVEQMYPEIKVWETVTPYFETRNIHFYVNRCGFHIVEFYNSPHPDPNEPEMAGKIDEQFPDGMFRFEKRMDKE